MSGVPPIGPSNDWQKRTFFQKCFGKYSTITEESFSQENLDEMVELLRYAEKTKNISQKLFLLTKAFHSAGTSPPSLSITVDSKQESGDLGEMKIRVSALFEKVFFEAESQCSPSLYNYFFRAFSAMKNAALGKEGFVSSSYLFLSQTCKLHPELAKKALSNRFQELERRFNHIPDYLRTRDNPNIQAIEKEAIHLEKIDTHIASLLDETGTGVLIAPFREKIDKLPKNARFASLSETKDALLHIYLPCLRMQIGNLCDRLVLIENALPDFDVSLDKKLLQEETLRLKKAIEQDKQASLPTELSYLLNEVTRHLENKTADNLIAIHNEILSIEKKEKNMRQATSEIKKLPSLNETNDIGPSQDWEKRTFFEKFFGKYSTITEDSFSQDNLDEMIDLLSRADKTKHISARLPLLLETYYATNSVPSSSIDPLIQKAVLEAGMQSIPTLANYPSRISSAFKNSILMRAFFESSSHKLVAVAKQNPHFFPTILMQQFDAINKEFNEIPSCEKTQDNPKIQALEKKACDLQELIAYRFASYKSEHQQGAQNPQVKTNFDTLTSHTNHLLFYIRALPLDTKLQTLQSTSPHILNIYLPRLQQKVANLSRRRAILEEALPTSDISMDKKLWQAETSHLLAELEEASEIKIWLSSTINILPLLFNVECLLKQELNAQEIQEIADIIGEVKDKTSLDAAYRKLVLFTQAQ
jgi:hypothetical protein